MLARVAAALALSMAAGAATAHEVRPAVMDVAVGEALRATVDLNAEAILAGVDLSVWGDTDAAPEAAEYDRLRAMDGVALANELEAAWPRVAQGLALEGAGAPALRSVDVGAEGNPDLPRDTRVVFEAPVEAAAVRVGWAPAYGELILREVSDEPAPFAGILPLGHLSPPLVAAGMDAAEAVRAAMAEGFARVLPGGAVHVLLALAVLLLAPRFGAVLAQVAALGLGQGAALWLAATGRAAVDGEVLLPAGVLAVVVLALWNVAAPGGRAGVLRLAAVLAAGAAHGLLLAEGVGRADDLDPALAGFWGGALLAQVLVIAAAAALIALPPRRYEVASVHEAASQPASYAIALVALWPLVAPLLPPLPL